MRTVAILFGLWVVCGAIAFAAHAVRSRKDDRTLAELLFQLAGALLLGVVALAGILTNEDRQR